MDDTEQYQTPRYILNDTEQCQETSKCVMNDTRHCDSAGCTHTQYQSPAELGGSSCPSNAQCQGDEVQLTDTNVVAVPSDENPPRGVSTVMWQKFRELQKRRLDVTRGSTAKRIKRLQKDITDEVSRELGSTEEPPSCESIREANDDHVHNDRQVAQQVSICDSGPSGSKPSSDSRERWCDVKPYLGVNEHLKGLDQGKYAPKTKLEEKIDDAISLGDFQTAENLSDRLSTRDFGKKVADAFDARKYAEGKKKEEERKSASRKKKLEWGFDIKHRWETKGNM